MGITCQWRRAQFAFSSAQRAELAQVAEPIDSEKKIRCTPPIAGVTRMLAFATELALNNYFVVICALLSFCISKHSIFRRAGILSVLDKNSSNINFLRLTGMGSARIFASQAENLRVQSYQ
jgi:hypothetical protein